MPITIKHGAELEGKGLAYGAAARAAYIRRQEKEQKKEQKEAKRLGNIGSVISTAGAVASFIPGLQPVGIGMSIAGGALGAAAGGAGDPAGKVIASTAQGISQVYQAQASKVEARQQEWDSWKERQDYAQELSALSKQQTLDQEVEVRDREFINLTRGQNQKYQDQKNAVLSAVGLDAFKSYDLDTLEEVSLNSGQYGNALKQAVPKIKELWQEHIATLQQIREARQNDPTITVERLNKEKREAAETQRKQAEQEQKLLEQKAKDSEQQAKTRRTEMNTNLNIISDVSKEIDKLKALQKEDETQVSNETLDALTQQLNKGLSNISTIKAREVQDTEIRLANGDPVIWKQANDAWQQRRVEELLTRARVLAGDAVTDTQWAARVGGQTVYYEGIAKEELKKMYQTSKASTMREVAELFVDSQFGLMNIEIEIPTIIAPAFEQGEEKESLGDRMAKQWVEAVKNPKKEEEKDDKLKRFQQSFIRR